MNYRMIAQMLGRVITIEAALLAAPMTVALIYGESPLPFLYVMALCALVGGALWRVKVVNHDMYAREGFAIVALAWIILSAFGALPFVLSGDIPHYLDALFETVSGFTTTGATILTNVEVMGKGCMFWRCFTHWVGGMGVLVFIMAILPMSGEYSMHIMRAEVPGPVVGKLVPRVKKTAAILYLLYVALTVTEIILLCCGGMSLYEAMIHSFSTAGTGGFSDRNASAGGFQSVYIEMVIAVFMLLFGVNFNLYFFVVTGRWKEALKSQELWVYLGVVAFATLSIGYNILPQMGSWGQSLRYSFFQVNSVITTTGMSTINYDPWPQYSRMVIVLLTFLGACAGSTGGGIKVSRVIILFKAAKAEIARLLRPRSVNRVRMDSRSVDEKTVHCTLVFAFLYVAIVLFGTLVVSLDGFDFTTNFTSALTCMSNVGPGLNVVGPAGNFAGFSYLSKVTLTLCMLLGRLEIFPVLILFAPSLWKKN